MKLAVGVLYTLLPALVLFAIASLFTPYVTHFSASGLLAGELVSGFLLLVVMILSLQFNHSRIFFALLSVTGLSAGLLLLDQIHAAFVREALNASLSLLIPLNLMVFSFNEERGIFSRYGAWRFSLLAFELCCIAALVLFHAVPVIEALQVRFIHFKVLDNTPITQPGLLLLGAGLILLNDRLILRHSAELASFFLATVAVGVMLHRQDPATVTVFSAVIAIGFGRTVIQESWNMAYLDELTGLPGRRALEEQMRQLSGHYVISMVDVDHFKRFNDTYGHDVGDQVLRFVASRLQRQAGSGKPFRYGGEEFCILYPARHTEDAIGTLEALRADIESCRFEMRRQERRTESKDDRHKSQEDPGPLSITVSIGIAGSSPGDGDPWAVLKSADKALYAAKHGGRNRVFVNGG